MGQYLGPDVSLKDTAIAIREDGKRVWRGKCPSYPGTIAQTVRKHTDAPPWASFSELAHSPLGSFMLQRGKDCGQSASRHGMLRRFWASRKRCAVPTLTA